MEPINYLEISLFGIVLLVIGIVKIGRIHAVAVHSRKAFLQPTLIIIIGLIIAMLGYLRAIDAITFTF